MKPTVVVRPTLSSRPTETKPRPTRVDRPTALRPQSIDFSSLRPYQREGVAWLRSRTHALLAYEMRLGKTPCTLRALPRFAEAIAVVPASIKLDWAEQTRRWRPDLTPRIYDVNKNSLRPHPGELVITNYEALPDPISSKALLDENLKSVFLIFDEAHYLKEPDALRSGRCRALARQVRSVWALTGTPLLGTPMDLLGVLDAVGLVRGSFGSVKRFLEVFDGRPNPRPFSGPRYLFGDSDFDEAHRLLSKVMLRKRRQDVFLDLPPKVYTTLPVPIAASEAIDAAEKKWQVFGATKFPPLELLSEALTELARLKIPALLEAVLSYEEQSLPLLVFSRHRAPVDALAHRQGWAVIHGDVGLDDRHEIVRRFQAGELLGVALTIQSGGLGLALHRAADVLFVSKEWTPALNEQAEDRAVSVEQIDKTVHVCTLVADHPLDRRLDEILSEKTELIEGVVR